MLENALNIYRKCQEDILKEYLTFLRFQTIGSTGKHTKALDACADWLADFIKECAMEVELWGESGKKTLFARTPHQEGKETILFYGHYDVQPVDPLSEWISPPFEPVIRNEKVFARGAVDDKGQILYTLVALRAYYKLHGSFPLNIKILIEGEEEYGSETLSSLLKEKRDALKAHHIVFVDGAMNEDGTPAINLGARGLVAIKVSLVEGKYDLHSGGYGGVARNPVKGMVELLSTLYRSDGSINIPGFFDEVVLPSPRELEGIDFSLDIDAFEKQYGFTPSPLEQGVSPMDAVWLRPTLEIHGIEGGHGGEGFKTVIPAKVTANISCRLVPRQIPERIAALVVEHLKSHAPKGFHLTVEIEKGSGRGFRLKGSAPIVQKMAQAYTEVFQKQCKKILCGGSIPVAAELVEVTGADAIIVGVCLGEDAIHAPNESFSLDRFEKGYLSIFRLISLFENN